MFAFVLAVLIAVAFSLAAVVVVLLVVALRIPLVFEVHVTDLRELTTEVHRGCLLRSSRAQLLDAHTRVQLGLDGLAGQVERVHVHVRPVVPRREHLGDGLVAHARLAHREDALDRVGARLGQAEGRLAEEAQTLRRVAGSGRSLPVVTASAEDLAIGAGLGDEAVLAEDHEARVGGRADYAGGRVVEDVLELALVDVATEVVLEALAGANGQADQGAGQEEEAGSTSLKHDGGGLGGEKMQLLVQQS